MDIVLNGAQGTMGRKLISLLEAPAFAGRARIAAAVDEKTASFPQYRSLEEYSGPADVVIDFSFHTAINTIIPYIKSKKLPVVIATTGHTQTESDLIREASLEIPIFYASNMSMGVALLVRFAKEACRAFPGADIEIVEKHHNRKKDAPSGTAVTIAEALREVRPDAGIAYGRHGMVPRSPGEITVHSLRMGDIVGEHEVFVTTATQQIAIKHEAYDRALFAEGALCAAEFLIGRPAGLYGMEDMIV